MNGTIRIKRSGLAPLLFVMGGIGLLATFAFGAMAIATAVGDEDLPPGLEASSEAVVLPGKMISAGLGQPMLYGRLRVNAVTRGSRGSRFRTVLDEVHGNPQVSLRIDGQAQPAQMPTPTFQNWYKCRPEVLSLSSLAGTAIEPRIPNWKTIPHRRFSITIWGLRPGQKLVVARANNGLVSRVWCGEREDILERERAFARRWGVIQGGIGGVMGLFGLLTLIGGFVSRRRQRARAAAEAAHPPPMAQALAGVLASGRATCEGEIDGRRYHVRSSSTKYGFGPVQIKLETPLRTRLALARRPAAGAAIDRVAGLEIVNDAEMGYPGLQLTMTDRPWAARALASPELRAAAEAFFASPASGETVVFSLRPLALVVSLSRPDAQAITPEVAERWLRSMADLLRALEALPPPAQALHRNRLERTVDDPRARRRAIILVLLLFLGLPLLLVLGAILLLTNL